MPTSSGPTVSAWHYWLAEMGIPYVITLRGKIYECLKVPAQTRQCAEALQGAAAVISVSSRMAEEARKLGVAAERVHVIPNGVDRELFRPRNKGECRRLLGLPEDGATAGHGCAPWPSQGAS